MKTYAKVILAGVFALAAASQASAQVRIGVVAGGPQAYYPAAVRVQSHYVTSPGYYRHEESREMREREWRRIQWHRHQEWLRHEEWRRAHWRGYGARPYDRY